MRDHELLVLHCLALQLELVYEIEVRVRNLKPHDAVDVVLLHEDLLRYRFQQAQQ